MNRAQKYISREWFTFTSPPPNFHTLILPPFCLIVVCCNLYFPVKMYISFLVLVPRRGGFTLELCYNSGHISNPFSPLFIPNVWTSLPPFRQCGQELTFKTFWSHSELCKRFGISIFLWKFQHHLGMLISSLLTILFGLAYDTGKENRKNGVLE